MARPDKNVVDYFPHQCEHGKTLFILENKYPFKGYCVWFKTLELLGKSNNHFIDCRGKEDWQYLSAYMRLTENELQEIYDTLKDFNYIVPQGSPMSGIGNNLQTVSLSNCFVVGNDSY